MFKIFILKIIEKYCCIFKKDSMQYRLERYRLYGAKIGGGVRAFSPIWSSEPYLISVGDNTTVSTGVKFCTHDNSVIKLQLNGTDLVGPISIGKNCFIGMNTILLPGVSISDNCIIAAGSVVTRSCSIKGSIIGGNPAKIIGKTEDFKKKNIDSIFDFRGCNSKGKMDIILSSSSKWIFRGEMK